MNCNTRIKIDFTLHQCIMMSNYLTSIPHSEDLIDDSDEKRTSKINFNCRKIELKQCKGDLHTCSISTLFCGFKSVQYNDGGFATFAHLMWFNIGNKMVKMLIALNSTILMRKTFDFWNIAKSSLITISYFAFIKYHVNHGITSLYNGYWVHYDECSRIFGRMENK